MALSCVRGLCLANFSADCTPVQTVAARAILRSAHHGHLIVPATKMKTFGSRSFCSAAPTVWNSLPFNLIDVKISRGQFASGLKAWLCLHVGGASENIIVAAPYKCADILCLESKNHIPKQSSHLGMNDIPSSPVTSV